MKFLAMVERYKHPFLKTFFGISAVGMVATTAALSYLDYHVAETKETHAQIGRVYSIENRLKEITVEFDAPVSGRSYLNAPESFRVRYQSLRKEETALHSELEIILKEPENLQRYQQVEESRKTRDFLMKYFFIPLFLPSIFGFLYLTYLKKDDKDYHPNRKDDYE